MPPAEPKIYHIVHVDRLASIVADGLLWCDAEAQRRASPGTIIGMTAIKQRRLTKSLTSHPGLHVGDCVPFYFCPRSVMLYVINRANHSNLAWRGGQDPIVHIEVDLREVVAWADRNGHRWAFTLSNAASSYAEDRCRLEQLDELDWDAIKANHWRDSRDGKQAEFLVERSFPWTLVRRIGVLSRHIQERALDILQTADHRLEVEVRRDWYY